jgi:hypothetical protein
MKPRPRTNEAVHHPPAAHFIREIQKQAELEQLLQHKLPLQLVVGPFRRLECVPGGLDAEGQLGGDGQERVEARLVVRGLVVLDDDAGEEGRLRGQIVPETLYAPRRQGLRRPQANAPVKSRSAARSGLLSKTALRASLTTAS